MIARLKAGGMVGGSADGALQNPPSAMLATTPSLASSSGGVSMWSKLRGNVVKEEAPAFVNFTKSVMALAAAKYNEELESLCDLFGQSSMYTAGTKSSVALPSLKSQIIDRYPTNAYRNEYPPQASPIGLGPTNESSCSSGESDDEEAFWRNRRKTLGGEIQRQDSDSFIPMPDTPPPPDSLPEIVQAAPPSPPKQAAEVKKQDEKPSEAAPEQVKLTRWGNSGIENSPPPNTEKPKNVIKKLLPNTMIPRQVKSQVVPQEEEEVEEVNEEQDDDALPEEEAVALAAAKERAKNQATALRKLKLEMFEKSRWARMNAGQRADAACKIVTQNVCKNMAGTFGNPGAPSCEALYNKILLGLAHSDAPNEAIDPLTQYICGLGGETWDQLIGVLPPSLPLPAPTHHSALSPFSLSIIITHFFILLIS